MVRNISYTSEQKKLLRLISIIRYLYKGHRSVLELATEFDVSERTVYRYLNLIDSVDFDIDQDFEGKYFLAHLSCPVCEHLAGRADKPGKANATNVHRHSPAFN